MNTPYAVRLSRNALMLLLVVGLLTTSCKKSGGSDLDPRDQYVGTYEGQFRITINIGADALASEGGASTTTITKGANPNEIYLETVYNKSYTEKVTAQLDGTNFMVTDKNTDQITINNTKITSDYNATGVFDKNQFAYSASAKALRNGTQYSKTYEITGTKK